MNNWQVKFEELLILNGRVPQEQQSVLKKWCNNQRVNYKTGNLSQERINSLNTLPEWVWEVDEWLNNFTQLRNLNGVRSTNRLRYWCLNQRKSYRKGELSQERINQLESLPVWFWEVELDEVWKSYFEEFKNLNGKIPPRTQQKNLHLWSLDQRTIYRRGDLSEKQRDLLESLPEWYW